MTSLLVSIVISCCFRVTAQSSFEDYKREAQKQFISYKAQKQAEFEAYRLRINREFAEYMRQAWPEYRTEPPIPVPSSPEPPVPMVAPPDERPSDRSNPFAKIMPVVPTPIRPTPLVPDVSPDDEESPDIPDQAYAEPIGPTVPELSFDYFGRECSVPVDTSLQFILNDIGENSVAGVWDQLSDETSLNTVVRCVSLRDSMRLSDWGYAKLIEKLADSMFPNRKNESRLMQMFLLTQSGYKVRIGRHNGRLVLLMPFEEVIYEYRYLTMRGKNYYVIDKTVGGGSIYIYDKEFPGEQMFSIEMVNLPVLPLNSTQSRCFSSVVDPAVDIEIVVNKNLIDFYDDYPLSSRWDIYVKASLSDEVKSSLYPVLREAISGKSEADAANVLLHFVQTAFSYETDDEQFGIERPLFPDETFFYPFSDCEDRAILYSVLVRELLGLDVALVHYPGHLATAVKFNDGVTGDYFDIEGYKYVVCDPTYINADIGVAMDQFKDIAAKIIKL